jgi:hypothetical protein
MMSRKLGALALALALGASAPAADEPKLPTVAAFDKLVVDSLRDVHNRGADLYNTSKDFVGTYRMYQGALEAVRPLLAHRPETQKIIETGLAAADKEVDAARKAFVLHDTIEAARKNLKTGGAAPKPEPPPVKKPDDKKPDDVKKPTEPVKPGELPVAPPPKEGKKPKDPEKPSDPPPAPAPEEPKPE